VHPCFDQNAITVLFYIAAAYSHWRIVDSKSAEAFSYKQHHRSLEDLDGGVHFSLRCGVRDGADSSVWLEINLFAAGPDTSGYLRLPGALCFSAASTTNRDLACY